MSRSSKKWISEHLGDPYVKRARKEGFRSRAAYKLLQIQQRFRLIRPRDRVLDLGAAPGGWSQAAAGIVGKKGSVVAVDRLEMEPIEGVRLLRGDILEQKILDTLRSMLGPQGADVILSDMAPNTSGMASLDQTRSIFLLEAILDLIPLLLRQGGGVALKIFQGREFKAVMEKTLSLFQEGRVFKPDASRSRSVEVYLVAKGYRKIG